MNETKGNTAHKGVAIDETSPRAGYQLWDEKRRVCITEQAMKALDFHDAVSELPRYHRYWDAVSADVWQPEESLHFYGRGLLFMSQDRNGTKYWILTEPDSSLTTILLPEEY